MICCLQPYWKGNFSPGNTRLTSLNVPLFTQLGSMPLAHQCLLADASLWSLWGPQIPKMCAVMTAGISMWSASTAIPNSGSWRGKQRTKLSSHVELKDPPAPCRYRGWGLGEGATTSEQKGTCRFWLWKAREENKNGCWATLISSLSHCVDLSPAKADHQDQLGTPTAVSHIDVQ